MTHLFTYHQNRQERAKFIVRHFFSHIQEATSILDVGCDNNDIKHIVGPKVTGIDIGGKPDYVVDLEKERLSRFASNSFDLLICTEVLEHVDNFHEVLDDMVRVANDRIIISLPNCARISKIISLMFKHTAGKFYGLPLKRPDDRHKWFFSSQELEHFFHAYANERKIKIESELLYYNYRPSAKQALLKTASHILPVTAFAQGYWVVLRTLE